MEHETEKNRQKLGWKIDVHLLNTFSRDRM